MKGILPATSKSRANAYVGGLNVLCTTGHRFVTLWFNSNNSHLALSPGVNVQSVTDDYSALCRTI